MSHLNGRPRFGVADVVRLHGARFFVRCAGALTYEKKRALDDIGRCRTAILGGHIEVYSCGHEVTAYNSCRNRACPKCLGHKAREWVEQKEKDLLPVPYFHVVFTLPHVLADVPLIARAKLYEALFRAASSTLLEVGRRRLGGEIGFLAVLHTWGQTLTHHPHVHCVVAGGALSDDRSRWIGTRARFFLPVRVLSKVFRGKMLDELRRRQIPGLSAHGLELMLEDAAKRDWVVYAKRPFGGPPQVLRYLARYTHRVAISDHRIVDVGKDGVRFSYKDYAHDNARREMQLDGVAFLSRFVDHVLPRHFVRLRSYGFLANAHKKEKLAAIRVLLDVPDADDEESGVGVEPRCACPICGKGALVTHAPLPLDLPRAHDTS